MRLGVEFAQPVEQCRVGADSRRRTAVDAVTVEPADVGDHRERAFEGVGVGLDHARHQHVVGEATIDDVWSPARALVERPGRQDPAVAHRDRLDRRLGGIHRDDGAGREHGDVAHRSDRSGLFECARHLGGHKVEMIEVGEVEHLQVDPLGTRIGP